MPPTTAYMAREKERENEQKQAEAVEEVRLQMSGLALIFMVRLDF